MKVTDLHIECYYLYNNIPTKITFHELSYMIDNNEEYKWKPIEINETILLKCGFKKTTGKLEDYYRLDIFEYATSCKTIDLEIGNSFEFHKESYTTPIKYLHELQLLYKLLIGKDLNIEL